MDNAFKDSSPLTALSAADGRYEKTIRPLKSLMSEYGLIRFRLEVMTSWISFMASCGKLPIRSLTPSDEALLARLGEPSVEEAQIVKQIETEGYGPFPATRHDVKACEYYLRLRFGGTPLAYLSPWIHFACTSEDVNNMAYALMLQTAVHEVLLPEQQAIERELDSWAKDYARTPMLARTHGQPASPTTFGKEMRVFWGRVRRQSIQLARCSTLVKWNGASGNFNAHCAAFPSVAWRSLARDFVGYVQTRYPGVVIELNEWTTQIEPHDTYAELSDILRRHLAICIDLSDDLWRYVSDGWVVQRKVDGEVGSSTMPNKVNPIDVENAKGRAQIANATLHLFSTSLPVSRLQRDLCDSTIEREFGRVFGDCLVAYTSLLRALRKMSPDAAAMKEALLAHPEVVAEAYQTMLRAEGYANAYEILKDLTRGNALTLEDMRAFVHRLSLPSDLRERMLAVTPENYIGLAAELAVV